MPNRSVLVEATLTTNGTPLEGKTITFKYRVVGDTTWTDAGTEITDANGVASMTLTLTAPQSYDFRVEFAGDDDYEPSFAEALNVKIKAKTALTIQVTPQ